MSQTVTLEVQKIHPDAKMPVRASKGASCFDVHAVAAGVVPAKSHGLVKTGLKMAVPAGYEIQVRSRSGLALKQGIFVLNSPGTVDSDYRGEVGVILMNLGSDDFAYSAGDRIAQIAVCPVIMCEAREASELSSTDRGAGGFGSTGTKA